MQLPEKRKVKVLVASRFRDSAVKAVEAIRGIGVTALLDVTRRGRKEALEYANRSGIRYVVFVDSSVEKPATIYDTRLKTVKNMTIETFLQSVEADQK